MLFLTNENIEDIKRLISKNPNDKDLGREARKIFQKEDFIKQTPNDQELGYKIRKIFRLQ